MGKTIAVAISLIALLGAAWFQFGDLRGSHERKPTPATSVNPGSFTLVDHNGSQVTDRSYHGKFVMIFFGYTFCPDVCPTELTIIADALDAIGPLANEVQPILISVDPKRDTPEVLAEYVSSFHPGLVGLTGSRAEIDRLVKAYKAYYKIQDKYDQVDYAIDHTALTYLLDREGKFVTTFPYAMEAEKVAEKLIGVVGVGVGS